MHMMNKEQGIMNEEKCEEQMIGKRMSTAGLRKEAGQGTDTPLQFSESEELRRQKKQ